MMHELTDDELCDLWRSTRVVQAAVKQFVQADGFNVAVQDGRAAGQSVPHVCAPPSPCPVRPPQRS